MRLGCCVVCLSYGLTPLARFGVWPAARVSAEVSQALANGRAVVALESTIISHGMPFPENLETARAVERLVREGGAVPATVALIDGVPTGTAVWAGCHVGCPFQQSPLRALGPPQSDIARAGYPSAQCPPVAIRRRVCDVRAGSACRSLSPGAFAGAIPTTRAASITRASSTSPYRCVI